MVREFKSEDEALALAQTLGLFITKKNGVFIVGNNKSEICEKYNMDFWERDGIFYDAELFSTLWHTIRIRDESIVDARAIELPYGIKSCCEMFLDCSRLKYPPVIPKSAVDCHHMFDGCKSLKYPPTIPESVINCFGMFRKCLSLKQKPTFPPNADTMFALESTFQDSSRRAFSITLFILPLVVAAGLVSLLFCII